MKYEDNPRSIKFHVKRYILENADYFKNKRVLDFPAGNGITSRILRDAGADVVPMDLFPEYFEIEGLRCIRANIRDGLPAENASFDAIICQEGIEHFSDQFQAMKEFSRVLKTNGKLLITTPNYSNLRAKLSYLLAESERFNTFMAPNELDSIWMNKQEITDEIYFGHIFLIGIQKLRVLAKLNGMKINRLRYTNIKSTALILMFIFYPFILLSNYIAYKRNMQKNKDYSTEVKEAVYGEQFRLAINPRILTRGSLVVEFVKELEPRDVAASLRSRHKGFGVT